jgi:hypothetical protein
MLKGLVVVVCVGGLCLTLNCVGNDNNPGSKAQAAACNECHSYPGSMLCKTDSVMVSGTGHTRCSECHAGSIRVDSVNTGGQQYSYFDSMITIDSRRFPHTDSLHANASVTLNYTQCTACHSFPPQSGGHAVHVGIQGKQCFECHFSTVQADTVVEGTGAARTMYFSQRMHTTFGGVEVPFVNHTNHINGSTEIAFRRKLQLPAVPANSFMYSRVDKSCSNIQCHEGAPLGASIELSKW